MDRQINTHATGPDWQNIKEEILCPLCEYDLQGLSESRCPECGYACDWQDLLDPTRRLHRYVFEHHPESNVRSFWKTTAGVLRPRRFWRSLQPVQPSRPRRLVLYWVVGMLLAYGLFQAAVAGCVYYFDIRPTFARNRAIQPLTIALLEANKNGIGISTIKPVEDSFPTRLSWRVIRNAFLMHWSALVLPLPLVFWPWAMFATLMVFRWSMRRAKVRPIHVLRCCIYTSGTVVWLGLAIPFLVLGGAILYQGWNVTLEALGTAGIWLFVSLLILMVYQLATAYRLYLRFDHSFATVFCAQVVVALAAVTAAVVTEVFLHY